MGMYDSFSMSAIEMPDGKFYAEEFQTKGLGCRLTAYRVTPDGRLVQAETDDDDKFLVWRSSSLSATGLLLRGPIDLRADFYNGRLVRLDLVE